MRGITKIICVEGSISSGKSTLMEKLKEHIADNMCNAVIGLEPLELWLSKYKTKDGQNLLSLFYEDPTRWAFTFQMTVLMDRFQMIQDLIEQNRGRTIIIERSIWTDYNCFARNLHNHDNIPLPEWVIYEKWFEWFQKMEKNMFYRCSVSYVYLRTDPKICMERLKKRSRNEESAIPQKYLDDIHALHDDWLITNEQKLLGPVYILNGSKSADTVFSDFLRNPYIKINDLTNLINKRKKPISTIPDISDMGPNGNDTETYYQPNSMGPNGNDNGNDAELKQSPDVNNSGMGSNGNDTEPKQMSDNNNSDNIAESNNSNSNNDNNGNN
jgi:deoxycitidine kinase